jgi:phosphate/sulfate permease
MSDTLIGAIIGASVALIGMIVAKESKISELRQQWIDGLRADIAAIISLVLHIALTKGANPQDLRDVNECLARVQLRLNVNEKPNEDLVDALNILRDNAEANKPLQLFAEDVVVKTQAILKAEWKRVKRGEWRYVTVLVIASTLLALSLGVLIYQWL